MLAVELFETDGRARARQRARDAAAQLRPLDHRRRRDEPVRAAPPRRPRPAARRPRPPRAVERHGEHARRARRTATSTVAVPRAMADQPAAKLHLYGKAPRPGRKIGHVTATGDDLDDAVYRRPRRGRAAAGLTFRWPERPGLDRSVRSCGRPDARAPYHRRRGGTRRHPSSASRWAATPTGPRCAPRREMLDRFGVPYEARVLSAHRTPRAMLDWGQAAAGRGHQGRHRRGRRRRAPARDARRGDHAAGHRRPGRAEDPRRARLAALDRADADRGARRDRRDRQRRERRPARRPHPRRRPTRGSPPRSPTTRRELERQVAAKDAALGSGG